MKEKTSIAAKCFSLILLLDVICFFLYMSFSVIAIGMTTKSVGYDAYIKNENGELEKVYTYKYADGEDTKKAEYESAGQEITTYSFRSDLSSVATAITKTITEVFVLIIMFSLIYSVLWKRGDSDNNLATFGHITPDKWKGLKIGMLAAVPQLIAFLLLVANKLFNFIPGYLGIYKLLNYFAFALNDAAFSGAKTVAEISVPGMLFTLLCIVPLPLFSYIGYYCGTHEISIHDKLVYEKKERKK